MLLELCNWLYYNKLHSCKRLHRVDNEIRRVQDSGSFVEGHKTPTRNKDHVTASRIPKANLGDSLVFNFADEVYMLAFSYNII